ncbi:hypothetical protein GQ53DRAFT_833473 [Thozetella sp. PMI_491]|nr:hypothetical protein GQ53DRAFT_833473 [Thozetella sp. PMI_491]
MTIINVPANETVSCVSAFSHDSSALTARKFQCWRDPTAPRQEPYGVGQLWTTINFDERSFEISVKQTWYCVDPVSQTTSKLTAISSPQFLNLSCSSTLCTGGGLSVSSNSSTVENLPPFSIIDPRPVFGGCTSDSMTKPSWTFSDVDVKLDNATSPATAKMGFNLQINTAGYNNSIHKTFNLSDAPVWVDCGELGPTVPLCKLQFDPKSNRISVYEQWICDDKSNFRHFSGSAAE